MLHIIKLPVATHGHDPSLEMKYASTATFFLTLVYAVTEARNIVNFCYQEMMHGCKEHGLIRLLFCDFGDWVTTQSMRLMSLSSKYF